MCEKQVSLIFFIQNLKTYVSMCLKKIQKKEKNIINVCCPLTLFFTAPSTLLIVKGGIRTQN